MGFTIAELLGRARPAPGSSQVKGPEEALLLWLRDGPVIWLRVTGADQLPPPRLMGRVEELEGDEAISAIAALLVAAGEAGRAARFRQQIRYLESLEAGRLSASIRRLEAALAQFDAAVEPGLEEVMNLLGAWAQLMMMLHGRDAVERVYERHVKSGDVPLRSQVADDLAAIVSRRGRIVSAIRRTVRHARALLRALRRNRRLVKAAEYKAVQAVKPASKPAPSVVVPAVKQAEPAPVLERKEPREHHRGEKRQLVKAAAERAARERLRKKLERAAREAARKRAAVRRGVREALRRRKTAALMSRAAAPMLPQIHAALVEALRWGAVRDREVALRLVERLRGREADAAAIVQAIDGHGLHDVIGHLAFAYDDAGCFEAVVSSASNGGLDAEARLVAAIRARGYEVIVSKKADRKAGVDAVVIVDGVGVCLQLTTMDWLAANTPTMASAEKRLVNGQVEVGPAVSKIQKDLEKFRKHYGDLPYAVIGVNVRMPFTPEQYVDDVLALIRKASGADGAVVAFVAAPGVVTYEEVAK